MKQRKIFLLLGHPFNDGFCGDIANAYEAGAKEGGHALVRMNLADMKFDPILHKGYREIQNMEEDLKTFQKNVQESEHFVIVYPVWWVGMPALLKGLFDRAWLPGSAFRYMRMPKMPMPMPGMPAEGARTIFWHRMYRGKTSRIFMTSGTQPLLVRFLPGNVNAQLKWGILWFAGFSVRTRWFGPSENIPEARKARWLAEAKELGRRGA